MTLTFNINSILNQKINVQLVKSAFNKNSIFNEFHLFEFHVDLKTSLKSIMRRDENTVFKIDKLSSIPYSSKIFQI